MTHTPAPWTMGNKGQFGTYNPNIIFDRNGNGVAQILGLPLNTPLEEIHEKYESGVADARLIAAAPELLEALKAALQALYDIDEFAPVKVELYEKIESAIAKAGG